ncbi:MAG: hypothetical protein JW884_03185 [Deltaproteobacteria bacterium]|nr:hypothetical protein [Deltaproteobacteria bacterium]
MKKGESSTKKKIKAYEKPALIRRQKLTSIIAGIPSVGNGQLNSLNANETEST